MTAIECMSVSPDLRKNQCGFTLVEIAIAIFIITILLGSILVPLTTQIEQRQVSETQKMLEDIKEALVGHAVARGYLPCPDRTSGGVGGANDTANDGVEDFNTGTGVCFSTTATGNVPWVTLGLGASDPWGNRFRYRVHSDFSKRVPATLTTPVTVPATPAPFKLATESNLTIKVSAFGANLTDSAVVVIISHGRNGLGAIGAQTSVLNPTPSSMDETANYSNTNNYVSHAQTAVGSTAGEFDDVVTWLGRYSLYNRMVSAGKLP